MQADRSVGHKFERESLLASTPIRHPGLDPESMKTVWENGLGQRDDAVFMDPDFRQDDVGLAPDG